MAVVSGGLGGQLLADHLTLYQPEGDTLSSPSTKNLATTLIMIDDTVKIIDFSYYIHI
jgi:hypothetical protein